MVDALALLDWRRRYLRVVGLEPRLALGVSLDPSIDLHVMVEMVDDGWPPHLVARLLARAGSRRGRRPSPTAYGSWRRRR